MHIEHHPLAKEFPEFKDLIRELKASDHHFSRLFDEYHEIDKLVIRMEENIEPTADHVIEDAKKKRLSLKDELYTIIQSQ
jgi:uncharacterized protein